MEVLECIRTRMSIRSFKPEPIPREILLQVVDTARWSPSYKNSQPWEVMIVSGRKKEALSALMIDCYTKGQPGTPDLPAPTTWPPAEQARIEQLYARRRQLTGLDLSDPEVIRQAKKANFSFYSAPHAIYLYQDSSLSLWSLFDLGLFAQSLMLAAHGLGLGTVPQAFATDYAAEIKEFLGIPAEKRLVLGLSIGYPDMDAPVNSYRTERSPVEEILTWVE